MKSGALLPAMMFAAVTGLSAIAPADQHLSDTDELMADDGVIVEPKDTWQLFMELDSDNNGRLTEEETGAEELVSEQFDDLDQDGDGELTREEFSKFDIEELERSRGSDL